MISTPVLQLLLAISSNHSHVHSPLHLHLGDTGNHPCPPILAPSHRKRNQTQLFTFVCAHILRLVTFVVFRQAAEGIRGHLRPPCSFCAAAHLHSFRHFLETKSTRAIYCTFVFAFVSSTESNRGNIQPFLNFIPTESNRGDPQSSLRIFFGWQPRPSAPIVARFFAVMAINIGCCCVFLQQEQLKPFACIPVVSLQPNAPKQFTFVFQSSR